MISEGSVKATAGGRERGARGVPGSGPRRRAAGSAVERAVTGAWWEIRAPVVDLPVVMDMKTGRTMDYHSGGEVAAQDEPANADGRSVDLQ